MRDSNARLLTDADVARFPNAAAVELMRAAVLAAESGELSAPARLHAADLTFTAGGTPQVFGFRAYHTRDTPHDDQAVVVWDASGRVRGIVIGGALGPLRTSALGALATQVLADPAAARLGLIGSGTQARAHALAVASVRELEAVTVYSRDPARREALAAELRCAGLPAVSAASAREVCENSNLLTLATNSAAPVIETGWIRPGTHVCTLGPKERNRHEFPADLAGMAALVVTDSPAQLAAYPGGHLFADAPVRSLGACLNDPPVRHAHDITVFLSVGLAGTEVLLADALLGVS
ncbi:ornithine cyclodeaminase family protein [Deinococcus frigens]|uniref:ornithine cyclodeaminase family protein n=1 Tax=Deinococcus frigens TaxID=249403 RepID=UPI000A94BC74|nr:ornithine cyclodeaminase family protein [Deinococcus frigens]